MRVFLAAIVLVGLCVLGMCIGILFRRGFPKYDVGSNPEMAKRGIRCFKDEDAALHRKIRRGLPAGCSGNYSDACKDCPVGGGPDIRYRHAQGPRKKLRQDLSGQKPLTNNK